MGRLSKATKGSSSRREATFTNSRLIIRVFEVVLKDSFLANTNNRERFTRKERKRSRARRESSNNSDIFSLSTLFATPAIRLIFT